MVKNTHYAILRGKQTGVFTAPYNENVKPKLTGFHDPHHLGFESEHEAHRWLDAARQSGLRWPPRNIADTLPIPEPGTQWLTEPSPEPVAVVINEPVAVPAPEPVALFQVVYHADPEVTFRRFCQFCAVDPRRSSRFCASR